MRRAGRFASCAQGSQRFGRLPLSPMALAALAISAPLAAREQAESPPASAEVVAPFELTVVRGEAEAVAAHPIGEALAADQPVCLDRLQFIVVSANGEEVEYAGPGCLEPRAALEVPDEVYAGSHIWQPLSEDSPRWTAASTGSAVVIAASGPSGEAFPLGQRLAGDDNITLLAGDSLTLLGAGGSRVLRGPGTFRVSTGPVRAAAAALPTPRLRTGAVRGTGPVPVPDRLIATRGTPGALRKFPRGTLIGSAAKICLAAGDRLTVARRSGASMTLAGPGCGKRLDGADADNTAAATPG